MTETQHRVTTTAQAMAARARAWLDTLDEDQRTAAQFFFPGGSERTRWFYTPTDHGGLTLIQCTPVQRQAALRLLAAGLSAAGYAMAAGIMSHELILERLEGWPALPGWGSVRDPLRYAVAVFGDPESGGWGWRFGGHHLSMHYTIADGALVSGTPSFFGADPAETPLPGGSVLRPCAALEDLGRELVRSLDPGQLAAATLSGQAPPDIVTGNRPALADGAWVVSARELFRDADDFPGQPLLRRLESRHEADERALDPATVEALRWPQTPVGLPRRLMRPDQNDALTGLLRAYLDRLPDDAAQTELAKVTGDGGEDLHFAWAGSTEPHRPHYYRIHGRRLVVEYDNSQRDANHVHTVWRDPEADFGLDVLAAHYAASH